MGNNKNLIILVVVLVVLVGGYLLTQDRRPELDTTGGFVELIEGQLSTDDVYTVSVNLGGDPDEGFTAVQRDGAWVVSSHWDAPANLNKIRTLLGNLESVRGEFRSEDPDVLDAYALDDSSAYHVRVLDEGGAPLAELLVGKRSGSGSFVRRPGSDRVMLADHNFLSDFGAWGDTREAPTVTSWIDMTVVELDREAVRAIELDGSETALTLTKEFVEVETAPEDTTATDAGADPDAYEWKVTGPETFVASKTRADGVMAAMVSMRARDVVGDTLEPHFGLSEADAQRVTVTMEDGTTHTLLFGAPTEEDDSMLYFTVEGEPLVWTVPDYVATNVFKAADDLKSES